MKRTLTLTCFLFLFVPIFLFSQDTLVLQPGPAEGMDVSITTYYPDEGRPEYELFRSMAWTHSGTPASHRCLIKWDLSIFTPETTILEAKLDLYFATWAPNYQPHTGDNASYLLRVTERWEEYEVTWITQPATAWADAIILPTSTSPDQDYTDIDVTSQLQRMIAHPDSNNGFMLRLLNEQYYRCMLFASSDHPDPLLRPRLRIIYTGCTVPEVDFDFETSGLNASFEGISPTAYSWHWDFGDGDTSSVQNPMHYYQSPGIYQVCLTVEDSCYFNQYCEEIEICIAPPVAGFSYSFSDVTAYFFDSTDFATSWFWNFGDGYYSSVRNPFHTYDSSGTYEVCLFAGNNCGSDTLCQLLDVCFPPVSSFNFYTEDFSAYFLNYSENATEYYWDFGDGYYSDLENPWHEYESPGLYEACLITMNECEEDTICEYVHIYSVSTPENDEESYVIYPNPARNKVYINLKEQGILTISLFDLGGKNIKSESISKVTGETIAVDLENVNAGIYILKLESGTTSSFNKIAVVK